MHLSQAEHNRATARHLLSPPFHDWSITAAFYAAIHYFEAWIYDQPETHTETSIPADGQGQLRYTAHSWREQLVQKRIPKEAFKSFRLLREASETARYLSLSRLGTGSASWVTGPAPDFFALAQAKALVEGHLDEVRAALRAEWRIFVEELDLVKLDAVAGTLARKKLVTTFRNKDDLLSRTPNDLGAVFGRGELSLIQQALEAKGLTLLGYRA